MVWRMTKEKYCYWAGLMAKEKEEGPATSEKLAASERWLFVKALCHA